MGIRAVSLELGKEYVFEVTVALTPNLHHPAVLRLSRKRMEIEITGEWTTEQKEDLKYRYDVVRCRTFAQRFYLFGLVQSRSQWGVLEHFPSPRTYFRAAYEISQLISTESDYFKPAQLTGFTLHSPDLVRWIGNTTKQEEIAQQYVDGHLFSSGQANEFVVQLGPSLLFACGYDVSAFHSSPEQRVGVEFPPSLTLIHKEPMTFEVLFGYLTRTLALFDFLLGFAMDVTDIDIHYTAPPYSIPAKVYFPTSESDDRPKDSPIFFPLARNLRFSTVKAPEFPFEVFKAFFALSNYQTNLVLRFLKVRKTMVSEDRFLGTFRLVETMADRKASYLSEETNALVVDTVEKVLLEKGEPSRRVRDYIKRLRKVNEAKLNTEANIREVVSKVGGLLPEYLRKDEGIVGSMVKLRNDITHANEYEVSERQLAVATLLNEFLATFQILQMLAVEPGTAERILPRARVLDRLEYYRPADEIGQAEGDGTAQ